MNERRVEGTIDIKYIVYMLDGDDETVIVNVDAKATRTTEHNYGADADGNRGIDVYDYTDFVYDQEDAYTKINAKLNEQFDMANVIDYQFVSIEEESFTENAA